MKRRVAKTKAIKKLRFEVPSCSLNLYYYNWLPYFIIILVIYFVLRNYTWKNRFGTSEWLKLLFNSHLTFWSRYCRLQLWHVNPVTKTAQATAEYTQTNLNLSRDHQASQCHTTIPCDSKFQANFRKPASNILSKNTMPSSLSMKLRNVTSNCWVHRPLNHPKARNVPGSIHKMNTITNARTNVKTTINEIN